jgi:hypothetical protein
MMEKDIRFWLIWDEARRAAQMAAEEQKAKLGESRDLEGDAWLSIPGTLPFGRWAVKEGIAFEDGRGGLWIWDAWIHGVYTPSVSVHEAAASSARNVLAHSLETSAISMGSQLD